MDSSSLCQRCSGINLDNLVYSRWSSERYDDHATICKIEGTPDGSWLSSSCALCKLFSTIYQDGGFGELAGQNGRNVILRNPWVTDDIVGNVEEKAPLLTVQDVHWLDIRDKDYLLNNRYKSLCVQSGPARPIKILDPYSIDFDTIRVWLSVCLKSHKQSCGLSNYPEVPGLRVINVLNKKLEPAKKTTRYVALSYVWGKPSADEESHSPTTRSRSSKCEAESLHEDLNTLPNRIPATIEHAMIVVAELGFQFLWVDRYCVPQGESNAEERHGQIKQMHKIYHGADLTIIAAAGDGPQYGLPGVNKSPRKRQDYGVFGKHTVVSTMTSARVLIEGTSWHSRAWTYQEAIFSRRRLVFTDEQVFFECQEMSCRETVDYMWPLDKYRIFFDAYLATTFEGGLEFAYDHISEYTQRLLTYDSDALNAILGVLQLYSSMKTPVFHFWGVPMAPRYYYPRSSYHPLSSSLHRSSCTLHITFLRSLCWIPNDTGHRRSDFPAWSWAGWSCSVHFNSRIARAERFAVTVSIGHTDESFKTLEDTFHQGIKPNKLQYLSKTLRLTGKVVKLRAQIFLVKSSYHPTEIGKTSLLVWPLQHEQMYGDVQVMIPVQLLQPLDEQAVSLWRNHPPQLRGVLMERNQDENVPDTVFVLVVAEVQENKYERVGYLELGDGDYDYAGEAGPRSVSTGQLVRLGYDECCLRREQWETDSDVCEIDLI
ncbi:unnamed protein product [Fusarium venenatum]|uniref:Heterokaryon incompatibility domain-containing protein n=2 Tax=Fusarium venenatum TaxID=56646 RepID=A0A2L2TQE7_9HYPO|nr:uncharacterized protein FVRRES_08218 [Fusarium venenatum]CEI68141.1 unnamed protein product [Fusarium venenatum]